MRSPPSEHSRWEMGLGAPAPASTTIRHMLKLCKPWRPQFSHLQNGNATWL